MQNMINFKCEEHEEADTKLVFFLNQLNTYTKVISNCLLNSWTNLQTIEYNFDNDS